MDNKTQYNNWMKGIMAILFVVIISMPISIVSINDEANSEFSDTDDFIHGSRPTRGTIHVPDDYPTIQQAINASFDGDTIYVAAGTYYEIIVINKSISLIGESSETTIIHGWEIEYKDVVYITVDWVYVTGFKITNTGWECYGLHLNSVSNIEIYDCNITNNEYGILLYSSSSNKITNNSISNNDCGIQLQRESDMNIIDNNYISNNNYAINIDLSYLNTMSNNSISNNIHAIHLSSQSGLNIIENNIISNNSEGITLNNALNNEVHYNSINNNSGNGIYASSDAPVNASYNWWGDSSGPYHIILNPDGKGDKVTDHVNFKPWLLAPTINYTTDIDSDGMPDLWEIEYNLNPYNASDASLDPDLDGLTNLQEFLNGSKPNNNETDGDSLGDGFEVVFSKTKPNNWDTNGNGIGDGLEFLSNQGYAGSMQSLLNDWIGMTITWENYTIFIKTNSSVLEGEFEKDEQKLTIKVSGPDGTMGAMDIYVPIDLCDPEDIEIQLDGELINYTLTQNETHYHIHIEYLHSIHELTADFSPIGEIPSESTDKEEGFLANIYLMALIIALIIILLLSTVVIRSRSKSEDIGVQELPPEKLSILLDKKHDEGKITDETYNDAKSLLEKYLND